MSEYEPISTLAQARKEKERLEKENPGVVYALTGDSLHGKGWKIFPLSWPQIGPTIVGGVPGMDFGAELPETPSPPDWKGPK